MKLYKKIDLFFNGDYYASTLQHKTCKAAVKSLLDVLEVRDVMYLGLVDKQIKKNPKGLKARFAK